MSKAVRYQVGLVLVELVLVVTYAATGHGQVLSQLSLESWGMLLVALLLGVGISWLAIESCIRLLSRRHGDVPKNLQLWEAIANLKDDFVPRAIEARCITCGLSLKGMDSCRCPDCGTINYYLIDRDDARHLAKENGAVF